MTAKFDLIVRNARDAAGAPLSIGMANGRIAAIGRDVIGSGPEFDAEGMTADPGLHDHHIHLLATAAKIDSVDLADCRTVDAVVTRLRGEARFADAWTRAIGYDERAGGLPDRTVLDAWLPDRPLRIQDRTGGYWLLNTVGIERLGGPPFPECVELGPDGRPNGRIRRGDAWLRERIGSAPPSLALLGRRLAQWGVTGITDAGASNGRAEAQLLADAMPQRLVMMGTEELAAGEGYTLGPVKLLYDESGLPPVEHITRRISTARALGRNVAAHCVTLGELVFFLEALTEAGGPRPGDRIEHGGVIVESLIADIAEAGLTVVTQQNFIHDRGDRYRAQLDPDELGDLYRLGSLIRGGVKVLGGSDAPYGNPNPWVAIQAATDRRTREGVVIGAGEAIARDAALGLYASSVIEIGARADLILYDWPQDGAGVPSVGLTVIGGEIAWQR